MHIKSYYANRVEAAMEMASRELGEDAVFIQSKHTTGEAVALGRFEVVFGIASSAPALQEVSLPEEEPEDDYLLRAAAAVSDSAPVLNGTAHTQVIRPVIPERPPVAVQQTFQFQPGPVNFIGLPGAGKTTTVMKFAFVLNAMKNWRVRIVELQDPATGGNRQLRRFAEILDLPFISRRYLTQEDILDSPASDVVLIDAPGLSLAAGREADPHLRLMRQICRSQCHLVVPAWYSPSAMPTLLAHAEPFGPTHLLVTHSQGFPAEAARSLEAASGLPLSLLTIGREPQRGFVNFPFPGRGGNSERAA